MGLIEDILDGRHDHELRDISEAVRERRGTVAQRKMRDLEVGDEVRFVNLGMGAKYMNGEHATIEEINRKTVWVRLTPVSKARLSGTRFGRSSRIKVYPNNIELVTAGFSDAPLAKLVGGDA